MMSTYAIIKTGGKQVKVEVGQAIYVEKLNVEAGQEVTFNEVVLVGGENTVVGTPLVAGATVVGTVEKQGKQKKVVTYKYKPKKGSHRKQGRNDEADSLKRENSLHLDHGNGNIGLITLSFKSFKNSGVCTALSYFCL